MKIYIPIIEAMHNIIPAKQQYVSPIKTLEGYAFCFINAIDEPEIIFK